MSLYSCGGESTPFKEVSYETLMNEQSDSLEMIMSENGRTSYRFITPLVEGYTLAKEPYREFPKGVKIITYTSDSMKMVDAVLTSNYAIYYEDRKLWEAMGDVKIIKSDGKELYSQQLFWNAITQKIYSNVDTKIVDNTTGDTYIGEGFESDESMENWTFRRMKGRMGVDLTPREVVDSLATDDNLEAEEMIEEGVETIEDDEAEVPERIEDDEVEVPETIEEDEPEVPEKIDEPEDEEDEDQAT